MLNNQLAKIAYSYWFLGLAQVVHSMEETYTKLYLKLDSMIEALHNIFHWFPQLAISADLFAILNYLMIGLILGSVPTAEKGTKIGFIFMWSWAIIELLNGAFHIGTWVVLRHYFPGGISGPILFVMSLLFIQQLRSSSSQTTEAIQ